MTKSERNPKPEVRKLLFQPLTRSAFSARMQKPISTFGFRPSFGFREFGFQVQTFLISVHSSAEVWFGPACFWWGDQSRRAAGLPTRARHRPLRWNKFASRPLKIPRHRRPLDDRRASPARSLRPCPRVSACNRCWRKPDACHQAKRRWRAHSRRDHAASC